MGSCRCGVDQETQNLQSHITSKLAATKQRARVGFEA